ncbi:MAG: prolyl oligopeptidase family serine peptidase [Kofleriaceae bacterium]
MFRIACALVIVGCTTAKPRVEYPAAPRGDAADTYHGQKVVDPYRGLESDSAETRTWLAEEAAVTDRELAALPMRAHFEKRIAELQKIASARDLSRRGDRYYWTLSGTTEQTIVVSSPSIDGEPTVVFDPSANKAEGFVGYSIDEAGKRMVYGLAKGGGDWTTWAIRDLATGTDLPERIEHAKYYWPAFTKDGTGLYYARFPAPPAGKELVEPDRHAKVYFHKIGRPITEDVVVYERPDHPGWQFDSRVTKDGRYLVISVGEDGQVGDRAQEQIVVLDLVTPDAKPRSLVDTFRAEYLFAGNIGTALYFVTNEGAPMKKVVAFDLDDGAWREIIPAGTSVIDWAAVAGGALFVSRLVDAHSVVTRYALNGADGRDIALPGVGTVYGFYYEASATELVYIYSGFETSPTLYIYDIPTGKSRPWRAPKAAFTPTGFETTQEWAASKDGTKIPMFITRKRGLARDGASPTIITAYGWGGFSSTPWFDAKMIAWLERGGTIVTANVRGGGEYGQTWHHAAWRSKRQTQLDDFIACANHLVTSKVTTHKRLGMIGYSGGGTLVGSVLVQRPDLFGAAIPYAGVHDLLRFQLFGQGAGWQGDMGFVSDPTDFASMHAISPVHNAKPASYPATLIVTGAEDVRVAPLHSFKFAAALQAAQRGAAPVLLRVQTSTGHGSGTQLSAEIIYQAELLAFFAAHLRLN